MTTTDEIAYAERAAAVAAAATAEPSSYAARVAAALASVRSRPMTMLPVPAAPVPYAEPVVGDIVQLRSGSPDMTVAAILCTSIGIHVRVVWFTSHGRLQRARLPLGVLVLQRRHDQQPCHLHTVEGSPGSHFVVQESPDVEIVHVDADPGPAECDCCGVPSSVTVAPVEPPPVETPQRGFRPLQFSSNEESNGEAQQ